MFIADIKGAEHLIL